MTDNTPIMENIMQFEVTNYIVSAEWIPVGDEEGHVMGIQKREGRAVLSSGEKAGYSFVGTFDIPKGEDGKANGYTKLDFDDGSLIMLSWTSGLPLINGIGELPYNKGEGKIIKGTGRFQDIKGTSVFSGRQLRPASEDPKYTAVANVMITYTHP